MIELPDDCFPKIEEPGTCTFFGSVTPCKLHPEKDCRPRDGEPCSNEINCTKWYKQQEKLNKTV